MSAEKKDTRNQITRDAGLLYNVNTMKKDMIEFFKNQDLKFTVTNAEGETSRKLPMFRGSQVALTATLQELTKSLLTNVLQITNRDKSGLRTVTRPLLKYSIHLHKGFEKYYGYRLESFNKNQVYKEQLPFKEDDVNQVMNNVDRKLTFTPKAFNLLCFLLLEAYLEVLRTAYDFISFAGKRTLTPSAISAAIKNRFPDIVSYELCNELSRACAAVGDDIYKKDDGDEEDDDEDEEDEEEEQVVKSKTSKKTSKKASKKTEQIEEEDDEDDNEDEDEDEDVEDESEEEVVVAKKAATKKKSTKTGKKKARKSKQA